MVKLSANNQSAKAIEHEEANLACFSMHCKVVRIIRVRELCSVLQFWMEDEHMY